MDKYYRYYLIDLEEMISRGFLSKALDTLDRQLKYTDSVELYNEVLLNKGRLARIDREYLKGIISHEAKRIEENKISEFIIAHILPKFGESFSSNKIDFESFINSNPHPEKIHLYFQKQPALIERLLSFKSDQILESWYPSHRLKYAFMRQAFGASVSTVFFQYIIFGEVDEDINTKRAKEKINILLSIFEDITRSKLYPLKQLKTLNNFILPIVFEALILMGRRKNLRKKTNSFLQAIAEKNNYGITVRTYDLAIESIKYIE